MSVDRFTGGLPAGAPSPGTSFTDLLRSLDLAPEWKGSGPEGAVQAPEGTTVLALRYSDGVVMVGDRQATEGHLVAHRRIQKVFAADGYSAVAISGTAGLAIEMVRLFQTELEHYEKLEGTRLSLDGKATYLARMVRSQLPMVFQGLVVVPLFAGFDEATQEGRLYTFDVVGGRYEEQDFGATGSGGRDAKSFLRGAYRDDLDESAALDVALRALIAASEEDTATGGPDIQRGIFPNVVTVTAVGYSEVPGEQVAAISSAALEGLR
ncbi:MAG: proteasome subunit beta [Acidimicrobiia bacterium]|nr:proteasome subunit beta [Acidimicrobiia bacterium]MDH5615674.1 proteasome subunit beta [Acidimicrobiia bacterium]